MKGKSLTYHFHTEGAVVDGLRLDVDVNERTRFPAGLTRAKGGRHERLVTHGCRLSPTGPVERTHTQTLRLIKSGLFCFY